MSIPGSASPLLLASTAAAAGGYQVSRSLRFNSADSAYLSRTPAVAGSQTTYTFSAWIKRSKITTDQVIFGRGNTFINFDGADKIYANHRNGATNYFRISTAVYRDPSAWCHIVWAVDTTNATAQDRARIWFNNVEITVWDQNGTIPLNHPTEMNTTAIHALGRELTYGQYGDFCLADIHFIDGQALTPSSFTEVSTTTGQLVPIEYTGGYGTGTTVATATGALPIFNTTDTYGAVQGSGIRTDASASSLVLAVPLNGTNGGTTFTDQIPTGRTSGAKTLTVYGNTNTSTTTSKFYGSSGYFDGTGDYLDMGLSSDFTIGTNDDFTFEAWINPTSVGDTSAFGIGNNAGFDYRIISGSPYLYVASVGGILNTGTINANTWTHVAVTRSGGTLRSFINGVLAGSVANTGSFNGQQQNFIGAANLTGAPTPGYFFTGYIQEVRFYKNLAKYTAAFTPVNPTNSFYLQFADNSSNTASTLGKDTSGNSNNWTPNNFSVVSGTGVVTTPASNAPPTVDYLVVAGGGGGGLDGGGGGGGGLRSTVTATGGGGTLESSLAVNAGTQYAVTVGAGGAAGTSGVAATNGKNSVFSSIIAIGGGAGGGETGTATGYSGGSGGGTKRDTADNTGGGAGTASQGFAGGVGCGIGFAGAGGGGGAGVAGSKGVGGSAAAERGGAGGNGVSVSITGSSVTYGGGGGGANFGSAVVATGGTGGGGNGGASAFSGGSQTAGTAGTTNLGGGGGGGCAGVAVPANGGSGIVILRYANTYDDLIVGSGLTYSYANTGGYKIYSFTASATAAQSAGNDSLVDTPTSYGTDTGVGGEVRGNYATLNPLAKGTTQTLSNGNLDVTGSGSAGTTNATIAVTAGSKVYMEFTRTGSAGGGWGFTSNLTPYSGFPGAASSMWYVYDNDGTFSYFTSGTQDEYGTKTTTGQILQLAIDYDAGKAWIGINNTWFTTAHATTGNPGAGTNPTFTFTTSLPLFPLVESGGWIVACNFGQRAFAYPLSGFKALCDTNLGAPLVAKPSTVFDVITYTGTGSSLTLPNGSSTPTSISFTPDFAWLKGRSGATDHALYDAVRGVQKDLVSNSTSAETTETTGLTAFGTNTFTVGSLAKLNTSSSTYVAWAWNAGGSTVSNTAGSITSQVRANVSAGFSVVTYTGNGANATVGHGLGVQPQFLIFRCRDTSGDNSWWVSHIGIGLGSGRLILNQVSSADSSGAGVLWNSTAPTSTVFSIGNYTGINQSTLRYVAYCFASVVGYSNGFSYTGNGSADGSFVYLGFRPRLIMLKRSDSTSNWTLLDTSREGYNVDNDPLYPNLSDAEGTTDLLDITSNGFKLRSTDASVNASAGTYIGFAWAEAPFAYSRAR